MRMPGLTFLAQSKKLTLHQSALSTHDFPLLLYSTVAHERHGHSCGALKDLGQHLTFPAVYLCGCAVWQRRGGGQV
jgi:hypothetical protein